MSKDKYKVRNWATYNRGLINRARINIWIDQQVIDPWKPVAKQSKRGRPRQYSDSAILICVLVRKLYHLSLRGSQGFIMSVFELMGLRLGVPDYSLISRRSATLQVPLQAMPKHGALDIAVDSTGLKFYGEGEWKVRKHGWNKHRRWMKLHLAIDLETEQILAADLTTNSVDDSKGCEQMLWGKQGAAMKINSFTADMAFDNKRLRGRLFDAGVTQIIPPITRAVPGKGSDPMLRGREEALRSIAELGRKAWKEAVGYHRRSLAETAMYRYKTIIGPCLKSRKPETQKTEALVGIVILNRTLQMAKPISYKAA